MKRYTGQKALYEAISRSRAKAKRGNILERFLPEVAGQEKPPVPEGPPPAELTQAPAEAPVVKEPSRPVLERLREAVAVRENARLKGLEKAEAASEKSVPPPVVKPRTFDKGDRLASPGPAPMWWRLKPVQFHAGRVEISVSYHIGIAIALAVVLVVLAGFRFGQKYPGAKAPVPTDVPARATPSNTAAVAPGAASPAGESIQPGGDNFIVLATRGSKADLEPVVAHFAKSGIVLEIYSLETIRQSLKKGGLNVAGLPSGDGYMLVTSELYNNPQSPGTNGYKMRQKIADVGRTYKAEKGREPFAPNLFKDAYGMKISQVK